MSISSMPSCCGFVGVGVGGVSEVEAGEVGKH